MSMTAGIVRQEAGDLAADGFGIPERNQDAAPVAQEFLGVPVGSRYDGLSEPKTVGERARRHLGFVEIRRHVDVAHRNVVEQRRLLDELVEENDAVVDAELTRPQHQASR